MLRGLDAEEQPLEVLSMEQPNMDELVMHGLIVVELPVEQFAEEVAAVHVPSLEELAVDVAEPEHPTAEVPPFVDPIAGVLGDSLHFTADVHVIDTETSSTDDDGDNVQFNDSNNEEPLREGAEQGQSERVEDQQPRKGTEVGAGEVRSAMEEGNGSPREEEVVVVLSSDTEGKPTSTVIDRCKRMLRMRRVA